MNTIDQDAPLWIPGPGRIKQAGITRFMQWVNAQYGTDLGDYTALWHWSIEDVGRFWEAVALRYQVFERGDYGEALADPSMPGASWFPGTRLNFAQHLLRQGETERVAVYAESESADPSQLHWNAGVLVSRPVGTSIVYSWNPRDPALEGLRQLLRETLDKGIPEATLKKYYRQRQRPRRKGKPL